MRNDTTVIVSKFLRNRALGFHFFESKVMYCVINSVYCRTESRLITLKGNGAKSLKSKNPSD